MEAITAVLSFTPKPIVFELGTLVNDEREKTEGLKVLQLPGPTPLPYSDHYYGCFAPEWAARLFFFFPSTVFIGCGGEKMIGIPKMPSLLLMGYQ